MSDDDHVTFQLLKEFPRSPLALQEIKRLRSLVDELMPFMLYDIKCGLDLGPPSKDHLEWEASQSEQPCSDCVWYNDSLGWKERIDSGEFGDIQLPE